MAIVQAIEQLRALRWSQRRIARELGIDRGTVSRYVQALEHNSCSRCASLVREEMEGNWFRADSPPIEGWLCPALFELL
jgi:hypothetical protein